MLYLVDSLFTGTGIMTIVFIYIYIYTVYPKKYAHGFVVLCFVVVMQSFIMNSHEVFIHIHQGCFAGTGAIVRLPQCQWSKPDGYGKICQCITTTKHSKAKTVCIFLGIYCIYICIYIYIYIYVQGFLTTTYYQICNIRCTKSQNLNVSRLVLPCCCLNLLKPDVKSRMTM